MKRIHSLQAREGIKYKERKRQRRLCLLVLLLFFTLHVSGSHFAPICAPLVLADSKRRGRRRTDIATNDRRNIVGTERPGGKIFIVGKVGKKSEGDDGKIKRKLNLQRLSAAIRRWSKFTSVSDTTNSKSVRCKDAVPGNKETKNVGKNNNHGNNNLGKKKAITKDNDDIKEEVALSVISSFGNMIRENIYASKVIDFGCNTVRPAIGAFLLQLREHISQQGRGFGLMCVGVQFIVSKSRTKHVNAALRLKQMEHEAQESKYSVPEKDMTEALRQGLLYQYGKNEAILKKEGWKNVHSEKHFSLFKRRTSDKKKGPVTYLMMGQIDDVSPRAFLKAQIVKAYRDKWDKTMAAMETIKHSTVPMESGTEKSQDILYYRTRWPWPLKDRDYTLSRRCKVALDKGAIVFVSKSVSYPRDLVDGALRVDRYWCHSTFFSTQDESRGRSKMFDIPGLSYVTIFCDDTNVALPASVIDLLSRHAEKTVPSSMNTLFEFSKNLK